MKESKKKPRQIKAILNNEGPWKLWKYKLLTYFVTGTGMTMEALWALVESKCQQNTHELSHVQIVDWNRILTIASSQYIYDIVQDIYFILMQSLSLPVCASISETLYLNHLFYTHKVTLPPSLSLSLSLTVSVGLSVCLSLSLSHTHTHTFARSLSFVLIGR